jgi:predicted nucleic acid-binding protein
MSVIVSNTTPINYLVLIDHIAVLPQLYARVIIPQAMLEELQDEGTPVKVRAWVAAHPAWLEVRTVAVPLGASLAVLDAGEREAIGLAQELAVVDCAIFIAPLKMSTAHWMIVKCHSTLLQLFRTSYGSAGKPTARHSGRRLNDLRRRL